ncbi:sugar ABC transporter permease [Paenibacillus sp. KQZ6P-2]|uniref:Sugar ABC transporter permease n=1 Tax=Paenibacillus mangrovi TaxID=2931978 RepID=A0A9X2B3Z9_9BACL|nr:sugar ABC transporter permease [Paenibacillus mangrovi]MCJ8014114.1 sugar ABC transporter permease [Paenibacillus mangrovi]
MKKLTLRQVKQELKYEAFLIPALVGLALFFIWPIASSIYYSLTDWNGLNPESHFVGLKNYIKLFQDSDLMDSVKHTLLYAILMTLIQNIFAVPLAVALDANLRTKNVLRLIFFAPAVLSPLVVGFLWSYLMSPNTGLFWSLGLHINFLGNPQIVMYSLIFVSVWQYTGWAAVIYLANLQGISQDYYEAAKIDGAGRWKQFLHVTLPLLAPSITINVINSMVGSLKIFDIVMAMTQGGPGSSSETITTILIKRSFTEYRYGYGSAIAVMFLAITAVISLVLLKYLHHREEKVV